MSRRVQTGCSNCKRCTNSAVGEGARRAGRGTTALLTLGGSELVMAGTRNCRACGHKLSLHGDFGRQAEISPAAAPFSDSARVSTDPGRTLEAADRLDAKAAKLETKADALEAEARDCDETKTLGKLDAKNKRSLAQRYRNEAAGKKRTAESYRAAIDNDWGQSPTDLADPPSQADASPFATPAPPDALTEQLTRLADLKASGALTDDEFSAAKARLLR